MVWLRSTGAGAVIGMVLVLSGCGGGQEPAGAAAPPSTTPSTTASQPADDAAAGTSAPVPEQLRFTATTVDGTEFAGESLAGKAAVLWFWAPWCPKCNAEAPTIAKVAGAAGDVQFVGVAAQDQVPAMREFVDKHGLGSFSHLADTDAAVWKRFGVTYQPAYAFISSAGDVQVETDQLDETELTARVEALG
jgi:thiol-disulfide isomerase/thioredoxin